MGKLQEEARWGEARAVLEQARSRLGEGGPKDLTGRLDRARTELDLVTRLERVRSHVGADFRGELNKYGVDIERDFEAAFLEAGMGEVGGDAEAAAAWVRSTGVRGSVVAALDFWAAVAKGKERRAWLLEVARRADPDPWRDKARDPAKWEDAAILERLGEDQQAAEQPTQLLAALGLRAAMLGGRTERLLRMVQRRHPGDFWSNFYLGNVLLKSNRQEAIGYYRAALAVRPESVPVRHQIGIDLYQQGRVDEAIAEFRKNIKSDPTHPVNMLSLTSLATVLMEKGRLDEALSELRKAGERLDKDATLHCTLGDFLHVMGRLDEAIVEYRKAIEIDPKNAHAHNHLGDILSRQGKVDEAIAAFRKAGEIDPKSFEILYNLGNSLRDQGKVDEAIAAFRKSIEINPKFAQAHNNLGAVLEAKGKQDEAEAEYRRAMALDPRLFQPHYGLGNILRVKGRLDEAKAEYEKTIEAKPDYAEAHCNLGNVLIRQGRFSESLTAYRRGHELGSKQPGWDYPSHQWVRAAERMVELEKKLPAILHGEETAANADDAITLAQMCLLRNQKRYAAAARLYADAFAADPKHASDMENGHRYDAACYAALAAAGEGKDASLLPDKAVLMFRRWALTWLRAHLTAYVKLAEKNDPATNQTIQQRMAHWRRDSDLVSVRDAPALDRMPVSERIAWQALWRDVDELAKRVAEKKP